MLRPRPRSIAPGAPSSCILAIDAVASPKYATASPLESTEEEILQAIADELAEPKYRLGESWWTRVVDWLQEMWTRFLEWATDVSEVVGGPLVLGLIVGGALLALVVVVTANLGRRRARLVDERIRREYEAARGLDPADLERQALEAEERSDYETALRLLFRAGLIRLDRGGLIDLRPGTTSGTITATVPGFAALAERFDVVVYGNAVATANDPRLARSVMAELLTGAGR